MSDLTAFLEARIAEDEEWAKLASFGWGATWKSVADHEDEWYTIKAEGKREVVGGEDCDVIVHVARHDPSRVLAECKAKRWILGSLKSTADAHANETHLGQKLVLAGMDTGLRMALKAMAQPYRAHPDFDEDWALDD